MIKHILKLIGTSSGLALVYLLVLTFLVSLSNNIIWLLTSLITAAIPVVLLFFWIVPVIFKDYIENSWERKENEKDNQE